MGVFNSNSGWTPNLNDHWPKECLKFLIVQRNKWISEKGRTSVGVYKCPVFTLPARKINAVAKMANDESQWTQTLV